MPLSFPSSPVNGQTYTDDNSVLWEFDGTKWNVMRGSGKKTFSGVKVSLDNSGFGLTSTAQAISFDSEVYDTDNYFSVSTPTRITVNTNAFFRINFVAYTNSTGSSYTVTVKKNGSTVITTTTISPNQTTSYDEILELERNDYIEVYASEISSVGTLLDGSFLEVTRLGLSLGTAITNYDAFSGVRVIRATSFATTNTLTAVNWSSTVFDLNANATSDDYWTNAANTKLTVGTNGYFRIKSFIETGTQGSYNISLRKNGSTNITTANLNPNDTAQLDEIYNLVANDYIELLASDLNSVGTLTTNTYLEIVRIGV